MEFSVKSGHPEKQRTACVVIGVYESRRLSEIGNRLDEVGDKYLSSILRRGDLEGKIGQTLLLHNVPGTLADRVLLVGCGKERELGDTQFRKVITEAIKRLHDTGSMEAVCYLTDLNVKGKDIDWKVRQTIETAQAALYRFERLKTKTDTVRRPLRKIILSVSSRRELIASEKSAREAQAVVSGVQLTKDLANLPGNICTPTHLADEAKQIATRYERMSCKVLTEAQMKKQNMNALLAVSQGSDQPGCLIVLEYNGGDKKEKPYVLVGKGVTFDSGGISIKPSDKMDEMKYDMCGAASVLGTLQAVGELGLPINVVGVIPSVENLPSGKAVKPGDIVTTMSGQTVEILNTDAEGRLILCDALTYVEKYDPAIVIDIATLTGACVVALGKHAHGLLSTHNPLTNDLLNAGKYTGDRAWELPLWDEYQEQLDSPFADMANIGGRDGGTITAACFLSRYTKKYHWAHLDIAGTAWLEGKKEKGATGRPVSLLTQYLLDRCYERGLMPDSVSS